MAVIECMAMLLLVFVCFHVGYTLVYCVQRNQLIGNAKKRVLHSLSSWYSAAETRQVQRSSQST